MIKSKLNFSDIKYWRWFGFILAVVGAYILGNAEIFYSMGGLANLFFILFDLDSYGNKR